MSLKEYFNTDDDASYSFNGASWRAQTFTAVNTYNIYNTILKLGRSNLPGVVTVSIRATDPVFKLPIGEDLCVGTTNGDTLPTASPLEWREIVFGSQPLLTSGIVYAIIVRAAGPGNVMWRNKSSGNSYPDGILATSEDSGDSWSGNAVKDFMFENYGILSGGSTYQVQSNINVDVGLICLGVIKPIPDITYQSQDSTFIIGSYSSILVIADYADTYKWYKNDILIDGETNPILNFFANEDAVYKCEAINDYGSRFSNPIMIKVVANPRKRNIFDLNFDLDRENT